MNDPFASAPATDEAQAAPAAEESPFNAPPAEAPKKAPAKAAAKKATTVEVTNNTPHGEHVVTLKGGSGFDAPWYVIHASGLDELEQLFSTDASRLLALFERIQKAAQHFVGKAPVNPNAGAPAQRPQRQAAPQAAQDAPNGEERFCNHGKMRFRSGTSKAGKPYSAFFCASNDRNDECKAQFLR